MRNELKKYIDFSGEEIEIKRASTIEGRYIYNTKGESVYRVHAINEDVIPISKVKGGGYVIVISLKSKDSVVSPLYNLFD